MSRRPFERAAVGFLFDAARDALTVLEERLTTGDLADYTTRVAGLFDARKGSPTAHDESARVWADATAASAREPEEERAPEEPCHKFAPHPGRTLCGAGGPDALGTFTDDLVTCPRCCCLVDIARAATPTTGPSSTPRTSTQPHVTTGWITPHARARHDVVSRTAGEWNLKHVPGDRVTVWPGQARLGAGIVTRTRASAVVVEDPAADGTLRPAVPVEGMPGLIALTHVESYPGGRP